MNIKKDRILFLFLFFYICLELPFLSTIRPVMYDEAWYANTGYNFMIGNGFHNTIVSSGGNANFLLPLFIGIFFKAFGATIFAARLVSVTCGVAFIIIFGKILDLLKISTTSKIFALCTVICLPFFNTVFRVARPECLALVLVLSSIFFYLKFFIQKKYGSLFWSGLSLMLALLAHPFSSLFALLMGIHLFYKSIKRRDAKLFRHLVLFVGIILTGCIILIAVSTHYNSQSSNFIDSLKALLNRTSMNESSHESLTDRISVLIKFWFLSAKAIFTIPLLICVIGGLFILERPIKYLSVLAITYVTVSCFIFKNDMEMFPLIFEYFLAISVIIFACLMSVLWERYSKKIVLICISGFILVNCMASISFNIQKHEDINTILQSDIGKIIPKNASVFGPLRFWFFAPATHYISDHFRNTLPDIQSFNFIITNSVDRRIYSSYAFFEANKANFRLVYSKPSSQYSEICIYKRIAR